MPRNHILFACDGTGSSTWRKGASNSFTYQIYEQFKSNAKGYEGKKFLDGPPEFHGWGVYDLIKDGTDFLMTNLTKYCKANGTTENDVKFINENMGICLFGHSRGGLVTIQVARKLAEKGIEVHFLGLFDAVRMTGLPYDTDIPRTVKHCYHAIRDQNFYSRYTWGNAGTTYDDGSPAPVRKYKTNHGGLGGDPNFQYKDTLSEDVSFTETYQLGSGKLLNTPSEIYQRSRTENINRLKSLGVRVSNDQNSNLPTLEQLGRFESRRALMDMLDAAMKAGVPV
jgi:hypothetical protein